MQIPDPSYMDLKEWADGTMYVLSVYSIVTVLQDDDWRQWGMAFFNSPRLGSLNPPDPYQFDDWKDWAQRLAESMGNADALLQNPNLNPSTPNTGILAETGDFIVTEAGDYLIKE